MAGQPAVVVVVESPPPEPAVSSMVTELMVTVSLGAPPRPLAGERADAIPSASSSSDGGSGGGSPASRAAQGAQALLLSA